MYNEGMRNNNARGNTMTSEQIQEAIRQGEAMARSMTDEDWQEQEDKRAYLAEQAAQGTI
jgi:U3 small nucleolar RNA-associated protein 14